MGTIRNIVGRLNPIRPFKGAATSTLKPARDGWDITKDLLKKLKREAVEVSPEQSPRERFAAAARKHGLDKRKLMVAEADLLNRKRILIVTLIALPGIIAWNAIAGSPYTVIGCAFFMPYIGAYMLRNGIRLRQFSDRAGYQWREFLALFPSTTALVGYLLDPEF